jgi:cbb3-type cytochrome oxidase subunit 1
MMIFGVAYHVIPRFSGSPLHSPRLAGLHLWIANIGLALMVSGWIWRVWWRWAGEGALRMGAVASALGAAAFIFNIWRTLDAAAKPRGAARRIIVR